MTERTFDWKPRFDERSRGFAMAGVVPPQPEVEKRWGCSPILDQGTEGACVGFGWTAELMAYPMPFVPEVEHANAYARDYYHRAKRLDEWPGDTYEGTSVLAGAKVARERGFISAYRWCFSIEDLRNAVIATGPVVIGVNWYESMMRTTATGLVKITGSRIGGHCLLVTGYSPNITLYIDGQWQKVRAFRWRNSWGSDYGKLTRHSTRNGNGWVMYDDMARLLSEDGEACVPEGRSPVRF